MIFQKARQQPLPTKSLGLLMVQRLCKDNLKPTPIKKATNIIGGLFLLKDDQLKSKA